VPAIRQVGYCFRREDYAFWLDFDDLTQADALGSGDLELLAEARAQYANKMIRILTNEKSSIA
jgi:hypothetical protein